MNNNKLTITGFPPVEGLRVRHFAGEADFPAMIAIIEAASNADNEDRSTTLDDIKNDYRHLNNSDPAKDLIIAEISGEAVACSRVEWFQEEDPNDRIYAHFVHIVPEWRNQGIETAMIRWCEERLQTIASQHPVDSQRFFQTYSLSSKQGYNKTLENLGYQAIRYEFEMSRPLDEIPTRELPEGVEVRPVREEDVRKIWDASTEAFRDHWGFTEPNENDYISYKESKYFQPDLWQVAWHDDTIVGSVLNYIDPDYNQKYNCKRGWTEDIATQRAWRKRGIAKALIVRSMQMHKALGMTEVALSVDTHNPTGALQLYQSLGYQAYKTMITYRKRLVNNFS
ncbi:MAG: GNAT family N-acetyltransferase [Brevefilum sp.]|jgi:mycothiol synthase